MDNIKSSGLVGMSPSESEIGDLFIHRLKKSGVISHAIFSLSILEGDLQSKLTLGGFDLDVYAQSPIFKWHQIKEQSTFWELTLEKFQILNDKLEFSIEQIVGKPIIVDSGTSFIMMPMQDRDNLRK